LCFLLCNVLLYFLHIENSVGNVIFRTNAYGKKHISLGGAFAIATAPLKYREYWFHKNIVSLNFFYWLWFSLILYSAFFIAVYI
jgi:hypothetical protein